MASKRVCESLDEVRANIDAIDREIVTLIAARGSFVSQAARFKRTTQEVEAPQRVEQVISKVRSLAEELGAPPHVVEATYRAMISAFIKEEMREHILHLEEKKV